MIALGQFRDTFIIAVDDEGIAIIDQHVAHERVLFERITQRLTSVHSTVNDCWSRCCSNCRRAGATRSPRTAPTCSVSGSRSRSSVVWPCASRRSRRCFGGNECDVALRALAEDLEGLDRGAQVTEAVKRIAATMACHAAVKANYP
jgi:DNA mismatch repair protein MutL